MEAKQESKRGAAVICLAKRASMLPKTCTMGLADVTCQGYPRVGRPYVLDIDERPGLRKYSWKRLLYMVCGCNKATE